MANEPEKIRTGFYIEKEVLERCDALLTAANVKSRNEFVTVALRFYCGYLTSQQSENYLLQVCPPFSSAPSVIPKTGWHE